MLRARGRLALSLLLFSAASLAIYAGVEAFSSGIDEEGAKSPPSKGTLVQAGCSCHNTKASTIATAVLEGVPPFYVGIAGEEYHKKDHNLTIRIEGGPTMPTGAAQNKGGFNLQVSGGKLKATTDATQAKYVALKGDTQATHSAEGDRAANREFHLIWESPAAAGPDVQFILTVNSVNGDGAPDAAEDGADATKDQWARSTLVSMGSERLGAASGGAEAGGVHAFTRLGVNFLAYWVGVVSFIVLFVVLGITFFVMRYGESGHWASWKDRAAKDKAVQAEEGEKLRDWATPVIGILALALGGYATWQLWGSKVVQQDQLGSFTLLIFVTIGSLAGGMVIAIYYLTSRLKPKGKDASHEE